MGHDRTTLSLLWDLVVSLVLIVGIVVVLALTGLIHNRAIDPTISDRTIPMQSWPKDRP